MVDFQDLSSFITVYQATCNLIKNALKLPQLTALTTTSQTSLNDLITKNTSYNNKVNDIVKAFSGLKTLSARLVNALETTDAAAQILIKTKTFRQ